jgi:hypothetical protein
MSQVLSNTIIEAPDPGTLVPVYLDLIFRTDYFLAERSEIDKCEYFYETRVWFGNPSSVQLIIYK